MKGLKRTKEILYVLFFVVVLCVSGSKVYAGDSFANATQVELNQRMVVNFVEDKEKQYYKFTTDDELAYYKINFSQNGGKVYAVTIYEGDNTSYKKVLDKTLLGKEQEEFIVPLSRNHTYYMVCGDGNRGQLNFMFTKIPDDYPNTFEEGLRLNLGTPVTGNIEVPEIGDVDAFYFTTTGNCSYYEMTLTSIGDEAVKAFVD